MHRTMIYSQLSFLFYRNLQLHGSVFNHRGRNWTGPNGGIRSRHRQYILRRWGTHKHIGEEGWYILIAIALLGLSQFYKILDQTSPQ